MARLEPSFLEQLLGKQGKTLSIYARGLDDTKVPKFTEVEEAKSIGNGTTFEKDLTTWSEIKQGLKDLSAEVSQRLQAAAKTASVIQVQLKTFDFQVRSRQMTLFNPVESFSEIYQTALKLMTELWDEKTLFVYWQSLQLIYKILLQHRQISILEWQNPITKILERSKKQTRTS